MTLDMDAASTLRHDLVTPINHILGYCEILVEDADEKGKVYRSRSVRSVQELGRLALNAIDRALVTPGDGLRPLDLPGMGRALLGPCSAIVEACRAIEEASGPSRDSSPFFDDLTRIREAAGQLTVRALGMMTPRG